MYHLVSVIKNKGFRNFEGGVCQYEQEKDGFSHVYINRKVLADCYMTEPLEL